MQGVRFGQTQTQPRHTKLIANQGRTALGQGLHQQKFALTDKVTQALTDGLVIQRQGNVFGSRRRPNVIAHFQVDKYRLAVETFVIVSTNNGIDA